MSYDQMTDSIINEVVQEVGGRVFAFVVLEDAVSGAISPAVMIANIGGVFPVANVFYDNHASAEADVRRANMAILPDGPSAMARLIVKSASRQQVMSS